MNNANESTTPLSIPAADGYILKGFTWRHGSGERRPVVIVNPATSVRCRYYSRFAAFLHDRGLDVITYDYRGIGESRPASLKGFEASWLDWGRLDFEAVLGHVAREFPDQPIQVAAHSVGGFLIGLAPSSHRVSRVFSMGAQFAYWRDYCPARRLPMLLKWHGIMPALTAALGYFPGARLGWLEDTPRGVVQDWTARHPRFEDAYRRGPRALPEAERRALAEGFAALRGPTLALSIADDPFGTIPATRRLLNYYRHSPATHLHLAPGDVGMDAIGHFAFFHSRFQDSLWPIALAWLESGRLPNRVPGRILEGDQGEVLPASATIQRTTS